MFYISMLESLPNEQGTLCTLFSTFLHKPLKVTYYSLDTVKEDETPVPANHPATSMDYHCLQQENGVLANELNVKLGCVCSLIWNHENNEGLVENRRVVVEILP